MQRYQQGINLVEMLIVMVIAGMVLGKGLPAFAEYLTNEKIRTRAIEEKTLLQQARFAAINRNLAVKLKINSATRRMQVVVPAQGINPDIVLATSSKLSTKLKNTPSAAEVQFNGQGRMIGASEFVAKVTPANEDCSKVTCLNVYVSAAGQIKLCNPQLASGDVAACPA